MFLYFLPSRINANDVVYFIIIAGVSSESIIKAYNTNACNFTGIAHCCKTVKVNETIKTLRLDQIDNFFCKICQSTYVLYYV